MLTPKQRSISTALDLELLKYLAWEAGSGSGNLVADKHKVAKLNVEPKTSNSES